MTMTKRELIIRVAGKLGITQGDAAAIVEGVFDAITKSLVEGKRWELRDFGVFEVKTRAARLGRNPRTGEQVPVPERQVVSFRAGKKMKELMSKGKVEPPPKTVQEWGEAQPIPVDSPSRVEGAEFPG